MKTNLIFLSLVMPCVDFIYLKLISNYFTIQVKNVQGSNIKLDYTATIFCYMFLILGMYYFIIVPNRSVFDAFLLGIIIYGVFETTNKALLKKWKWKTVFIDTLWGGVLFSITSYIVKKIKI